MGVTLDPDLRIAGYRPVIFKNALRRFTATQLPGNLIDLKSVFPDHRRDGAIVFEECLDRRLIELREDFELTEAGETIARSKARRRAPLGQARHVLEQFLDRADRLNQDPQGVRFVDRIWLFGSVMLGRETVGDIDLALETSRRPEYQKDFEAMELHLNALLSGMKDAPAARAFPFSAEQWITDRALYGAKRHHLLAGVQDTISDLAGLGVACRLIYDRARGGRVDEPIVDRHPQSQGRKNTIGAPALMPDLTPAPLRPMDGRWIGAFQPSGVVHPYFIFRGWTADARNMFAEMPYGLRVITDDYAASKDPWAPKRLKRGGIDGRQTLLLANIGRPDGASVVLRRDIEIQAHQWTLTAQFDEPELAGRGRRIDLLVFTQILGAALLVIAADADRMLRRAREETSPPAVRIVIPAAPGDSLAEFFAASAVSRLQARMPQIEPTGWTGDLVSIVRAAP